MHDHAAIAQYVDAALKLHKLDLDDEQRQRVIDTFATTAAIAAPLLDFALAPEIEGALIFEA